MIIDSRAPTRIDLAGGTLDLWPLHLFFNQPLTINLAINLWASTHLEVSATTRPQVILRAEDQNVEGQLSWDLLLSQEPLQLPPQLELHGKLLRFFARKHTSASKSSLLISTKALSPAGAGLGGSSTLSVSLVGALAAWSQEGRVPDVLKDGEDLVSLVRDIETTVIRVPAGVQDYFGAMFGGLQALHWSPGRHSREWFSEGLLRALESRLILFYSGQSRNSGINNWALFKQLIDGDSATQTGFSGIVQATQALQRALLIQNWDEVGSAIRREWTSRRSLASGITTPIMDDAFQASFELGATGGKVCGAGGGGCFFLYHPEPSDTLIGGQQREKIIKRVESLGIRHLPFRAVSRGLEVKISRA